jgi:hypothetical protein
MMSSFFNEAEADQIVESNIIKHQIESRKAMRLYKSEDGQVFKVVEALPLNRDELVTELNFAKEDVAKCEKALQDFDALNTEQVEHNIEVVSPEQNPVEPPTPQPETLPEPEAPIAPIQ